MSALASAATSAPALLGAMPASGLGAQLLRLLASLAAVIGLILALAWLGRRLGAVRGSAGGRRLQCLESLNTGVKERLLLVRIDDTELLLGSSPQGLRTLHVLPARDGPPAVEVPPASAAGGFEAALRRWMRPQ